MATFDPTGITRTLRLADGRSLGIAQYGAADGFPVLCFHGVPGTRLMYRLGHDAAVHHGFRLIAIDRPGFGLSTPRSGRTLQDWLSDVHHVVSEFGLHRFGVAAISGGGPFATATAAAFGDRVAALGLISPLGPLRDMQDTLKLPLSGRLFYLRLPQRTRLLYGLSVLGNGMFKLAPEFYYDMFVRSLPQSDQMIMRELRLKRKVLEDIHESLRQGGDGARSDLRIFSQAWNVDFAAISAPTVLWQGLADTIVPIEAALRLGELIPDCTSQRIPHAGHFWVYQNFEIIFRTLRERLSGQ